MVLPHPYMYIAYTARSFNDNNQKLLYSLYNSPQDPPLTYKKGRLPCRLPAPLARPPLPQDAGRPRAAAMTARDRQRLHLVLTRVEQERQAQPGTIHKVVYGFMGNKTTVEVVYDDGRQDVERGAGTRTSQPHVAACPAAAHGRGQQRATCPPQPARR